MTEHEAREIANKYLLELVNSDPTYFTSVEVRKVFDENNFEFVFYAAITQTFSVMRLAELQFVKRQASLGG